MRKYYAVTNKVFLLRTLSSSGRVFVVLFTLFFLLIFSNSHAQKEIESTSLASEGLESITLDDPVTDTLSSDGSEVGEPVEPLDEKAIVKSEASLVEISTELKQNLDAQFQRISELEKTEDSFSPSLGEEYLSYGLLLRRAGRIDEAREMVVDALHIAKVNDGVYAIEQRPMLRALFEINLLLGNSEELEENFDKIAWLENKHPSKRGFYSFDLVVKLGHYFLDSYSIRPTRDNVSLELLNKAAKYFRYAIRQYGNASIDQHLMPYGELSLVHYHRSKLIERVSRQRDFTSSRQQTIFQRVGQSQSEEFFEQTFSKTELYAKLHLRKAESESNQHEIVTALLALGDSNLLFKRKIAAANYYKLAWEEAQKLSPDNPLVLSFEKPVRLPAFNFSLEKEQARRAGATYAHLPVTVNVDATGKVSDVFNEVIGAPNKRIASRARRIVKNSRFRPAIKDGQLLAFAEHQEKIRVLVSKR